MVARGCHLVSEMCRCLAGPGLCQAGSWTHATHDKSLLNWHFFCYYIILTNSWFLRYSMIFLYWFSATASITSLAFQVRGVSIRWERRKLDEIAVGTLAVGSVKLSWDMFVYIHLQCPWYCLRKMVLHTDWFAPNSENHTERGKGLWWSGSCCCHIDHGWWWGVILVWPVPSLLCGGLPSKRTVGPWMRFELGMPRMPRLPLMGGSKALFAYADTWITNCKTVAPSMWTNVMTSSSQVLVLVGFLSNLVFDILSPMI